MRRRAGASRESFPAGSWAGLGVLVRDSTSSRQEATVAAGRAVHPEVSRVGPLAQGCVADLQQTAGVPQREPIAFSRTVAIRGIRLNHSAIPSESIKIYKNLNQISIVRVRD